MINDAAFFMRYIRGGDRNQASVLPARIDDYVAADAAVRVIDAFVEGLDLFRFGLVLSDTGGDRAARL